MTVGRPVGPERVAQSTVIHFGCDPYRGATLLHRGDGEGYCDEADAATNQCLRPLGGGAPRRVPHRCHWPWP